MLKYWNSSWISYSKSFYLQPYYIIVQCLVWDSWSLLTCSCWRACRQSSASLAGKGTPSTLPRGLWRSPRWGHYGIVVSCRVALWVLGSRASSIWSPSCSLYIFHRTHTFGRSPRFWCVSECEGWCFTLWPTLASLWHGLFWEQLLRSEQIEAMCEHSSLIRSPPPTRLPESDQPLWLKTGSTQSWAL